MRISSTAAFLVGVLLVWPAFAEYYPNQHAGVSVYLPDHWLVSMVDDYQIQASTQDQSVGIIMRVFEGNDVEAAIQALEAEVMPMVSDFSSTGYYDDNVNGMPAVVGEAQGIIDGYDADLGLMVILTPTNRALLVFALGEREAVAYYRGDIDAILANIAPL